MESLGLGAAADTPDEEQVSTGARQRSSASAASDDETPILRPAEILVETLALPSVRHSRPRRNVADRSPVKDDALPISPLSEASAASVAGNARGTWRG